MSSSSSSSSSTTNLSVSSTSDSNLIITADNSIQDNNNNKQLTVLKKSRRKRFNATYNLNNVEDNQSLSSATNLSNESIEKIELEATFNVNSDNISRIDTLFNLLSNLSSKKSNKYNRRSKKKNKAFHHLERRHSSALDSITFIKAKKEFLLNNPHHRANSILNILKIEPEMRSAVKQQQQQSTVNRSNANEAKVKKRVASDENDRTTNVSQADSLIYENTNADEISKPNYKKSKSVLIRAPSEDEAKRYNKAPIQRNTQFRSHSPPRNENSQQTTQRARREVDHSRPVDITNKIVNQTSQTSIVYVKSDSSNNQGISYKPAKVIEIVSYKTTSTVPNTNTNISSSATRKRIHSRSRSPVPQSSVAKLRMLRDNVISAINKSLINETRGWINYQDFSTDDPLLVESEHVRVNGLIQFMNYASAQLRKIKNITLPYKRSPSVYFLYDKRKSDIRKYYANNLPIMSYTTEDICDLYMPKQLEALRRKIRCTIGLLSADSARKSRLQELDTGSNLTPRKRYKNEINSVERVTNPARYYYFPRVSSVEAQRAQLNKENVASSGEKSRVKNLSYTEQAKQKLQERHRYKKQPAYTNNNLNKQMKSSLSNLLKASHNLARSSEIRQRFGRTYSSNEIDEIHKNGSNMLSHLDVSLASEDIDSVYLPWMMENYGRKLVIEALRRRGNMHVEGFTLKRHRATLAKHKEHHQQKVKREKSPYVSQYYMQDTSSKMRRNELWIIDKEIRKLTKAPKNSANQSGNNMDTDVSITDSETSSEDTRPVIPEKINKPDVSLRNKIMRTVNRSLLSSDFTGIDLRLMKLDDKFRKYLRKTEKKALERELEHDLIRSFSCSHLNDLRKEDIRYLNMRSEINSYSTDDVIDLHMPTILETYKLKVAINHENKGKVIEHQGSSVISNNTPLSHRTHSPVHDTTMPLKRYPDSPTKSSPTKALSNIMSPLSPSSKNIFREIIQEKLNEIDKQMAKQIYTKTKEVVKQQKQPQPQQQQDSDEKTETDEDQDDSLNLSDDLEMNEEEMRFFEKGHFQPAHANRANKRLSPRSKLISGLNRSLLHNPSQLVSDFYISNMNYAMKRNIECVQIIADDLRKRRNSKKKVLRSLSVDHLYDVRREHIRYTNGAEDHMHPASFTTDDIQDIYMPWIVDNYRRKIAVELERRRRFAENYLPNGERPQRAFTSIFIDDQSPSRVLQQTLAPIIIDKFDRLLLKHATLSIQNKQFEPNAPLQTYQTPIYMSAGQRLPDQPDRSSIRVQRIQPARYEQYQDNANYISSTHPPFVRTIYLPPPGPVNSATEDELERSNRRPYVASTDVPYIEEEINRKKPQYHIEPVLNLERARPVVQNGANLQMPLSTRHPEISGTMLPEQNTKSMDWIDNSNDVYRSTANIALRPPQPLIEDDIRIEKANVKEEAKRLTKAAKNEIKPYNAALELQDSTLYQFSKNIRIESQNEHRASVDLEPNTLKHAALHENKMILNAPQPEETRIPIEEAKQYRSVETQSRKAEKVIEEYVRKSISESVTSSYEAPEYISPSRFNEISLSSKVEAPFKVMQQTQAPQIGPHVLSAAKQNKDVVLVEESREFELAKPFGSRIEVMSEKPKPLHLANKQYPEIIEHVDTINRDKANAYKVQTRTEIPKCVQAVESEMVEVLDTVEEFAPSNVPQEDTAYESIIKQKEKRPKSKTRNDNISIISVGEDQQDIKNIQDVGSKLVAEKRPIKFSQEGYLDKSVENVENMEIEEPYYETAGIGVNKLELKTTSSQKPFKELHAPQSYSIYSETAPGIKIQTETGDSHYANLIIDKTPLYRPEEKKLSLIHAPITSKIEQIKPKEFQVELSNFETANVNVDGLKLQEPARYVEISEFNVPEINKLERYDVPKTFEAYEPRQESLSSDLRTQELETVVVQGPLKPLRVARQFDTENLLIASHLAPQDNSDILQLQLPLQKETKYKPETTKDIKDIQREISKMVEEEKPEFESAYVIKPNEMRAPQQEYFENVDEEEELIELSNQQQLHQAAPMEKNEEKYEIVKAEVYKPSKFFSSKLSSLEMRPEAVKPIVPPQVQEERLQESKEQGVVMTEPTSKRSNEIFNMASLRHESSELSSAYSFFPTETDINNATETQEIQNLRNKVDERTNLVFSLPKRNEIPAQNVKDLKTSAFDEEAAIESKEEFIVSLKPSIFEIVALNAAIIHQGKTDGLEQIDDLIEKKDQDILKKIPQNVDTQPYVTYEGVNDDLQENFDPLDSYEFANADLVENITPFDTSIDNSVLPLLIGITSEARPKYEKLHDLPVSQEKPEIVQISKEPQLQSIEPYVVQQDQQFLMAKVNYDKIYDQRAHVLLADETPTETADLGKEKDEVSVHKLKKIVPLLLGATAESKLKAEKANEFSQSDKPEILKVSKEPVLQETYTEQQNQELIMAKIDYEDLSERANSFSSAFFSTDQGHIGKENDSLQMIQENEPIPLLLGATNEEKTKGEKLIELTASESPKILRMTREPPLHDSYTTEENVEFFMARVNFEDVDEQKVQSLLSSHEPTYSTESDTELDSLERNEEIISMPLLLAATNEDKNKSEKLIDFNPLDSPKLVKISKESQFFDNDHISINDNRELVMAKFDFEDNDDLKTHVLLVDGPYVQTARLEKEVLDLASAEVNETQSLKVPEIRKADEIEETVKPLETMKYDFDEAVSIFTENKLKTPIEKEKEKIANKAEQFKEETIYERCDDFLIDETFDSEAAKVEAEKLMAELHNLEQPIQMAIARASRYSVNPEDAKDIVFGNLNNAAEEIIQQDELEEAVDRRETRPISMAKYSSEESMKEEETIEFEESHFDFMTQSRSNFEQPDQLMLRVNKDKAQLLNQPILHTFNLESTERFKPEEIDYERPLFATEPNKLESESFETYQPDTLHAHELKVQDFYEEKFLDNSKSKFDDEPDEQSQHAKIDIVKNEFKPEVGIKLINKLNMALIRTEKEDRDEGNYLKELRQLGDPQHVESYVNSDMSSTKLVSPESELKSKNIKHYCLGQLVKESSYELEECNENIENVMDIQQAIAPKLEARSSDIVIRAQQKKTFIQNKALENYIESEKCDHFAGDNFDYMRPIENREETAYIKISANKPLPLYHLPHIAELDLEQAEINNLNTNIEEESVKVTKEIADLRRLDKMNQVASYYLPLLNFIDEISEYVKELKHQQDFTEEAAQVSRETKAEIQMIERGEQKVLHAPSISDLDKEFTESTSQFKENLDEDRVNIDREKLVPLEKVNFGQAIQKLSRSLEHYMEDIYIEKLNLLKNTPYSDIEENALVKKEEMMAFEFIQKHLVSLLNYPQICQMQHENNDMKHLHENLEELYESINLKIQQSELKTDRNKLRIENVLSLFAYNLTKIDEVKEECANYIQNINTDMQQATIENYKFAKPNENYNMLMPPLLLTKAINELENLNEELAKPFIQHFEIDNAKLNRAIIEGFDKAKISQLIKLNSPMENILKEILNEESKVFIDKIEPIEPIKPSHEPQLSNLAKVIINKTPEKLIKAFENEENFKEQQLSSLNVQDQSETFADMHTSSEIRFEVVKLNIVNHLANACISNEEFNDDKIVPIHKEIDNLINTIEPIKQVYELKNNNEIIRQSNKLIWNAPLIKKLPEGYLNENSHELLQEVASYQELHPTKVLEPCMEKVNEIIKVTALIAAKIEKLMQEEEEEAFEYKNFEEYKLQTPSIEHEVTREFKETVIVKPKLQYSASMSELFYLLVEACTELPVSMIKEKAKLKQNKAISFGACTQVEHIKWENIEESVQTFSNQLCFANEKIENGFLLHVATQRDSIICERANKLNYENDIQHKTALITYAEREKLENDEIDLKMLTTSQLRNYDKLEFFTPNIILNARTLIQPAYTSYLYDDYNGDSFRETYTTPAYYLNNSKTPLLAEYLVRKYI